MDVSNVSPAELQWELASRTPPVVVDVRTRAAFLQSDSFIAGALRRPAESTAPLAGSLPERPIVVYCEKGGGVGESAARRLVAEGRAARFLVGGVRGWVEGGGVTLPKPVGASTRWVTRERPKIDRIACPWLIARFIDRDAEFRYVKAGEVFEIARKERAIPFDVPDALFSHDGELCSFDAFLRVFRMDDSALTVLARIVRGADTGRLELAPECAGLLAASLGLSRLRSIDHEMLRDGFVFYDALYLWARDAMQETHTWNPKHPIPQNPPRRSRRTSREPFDSGRI